MKYSKQKQDRSLCLCKATASITFAVPTIVRGNEWILERLPSFSALLVKTPLWAFSFLFFFWCHVIYWHTIALHHSSLSATVKPWRPLFIWDKTLTLGCQTLHGNNESPKTFCPAARVLLPTARSVVLKRNLKISQQRRNSTSVIFIVSLMHLFVIEEDTFLISLDWMCS